ncbi:unnamed protein product [Didymodactylos carnosus]|uniref:3-deoxy-7-phosphoheptulonate synthase n=1 Tax=Didymodactylos carnosus TaxID=1234261 RepID=A0A814WGS3_9BILA|nr:unnamed protein product [Didymodactylos carnosus]CAF1198318.1 unnamed protein product [Didymodactylos carnosus]CAF3776805.1 unnamed protein product [Didymodactylos carnosus]CAF3962709.1 unnamed protein product [Didymodactylos carnosus]
MLMTAITSNEYSSQCNDYYDETILSKIVPPSKFDFHATTRDNQQTAVEYQTSSLQDVITTKGHSEHNSCHEEQPVEDQSYMKPSQLTRVKYLKFLTSPNVLLEQLPCPPSMRKFIVDKRQEISNIVHDRDDDRLLVIIGPCSIHNVDEAMVYAARLSEQAKLYESTLMIVMRVYFEKPRTTYGWKGLINDPLLDGTNDINLGLKMARQLLLDITRLQLPCSCEFLHPILSHYIADLMCWIAIGARTTESQIHREFVSGLPMPVGFKNSTTGNIQIAVDACVSSRTGHTYLSLDPYGSIICNTTWGNDDVHVVLRGGSATGPNYSQKHVSDTKHLLDRHKVNTQIMIDCSHGNSLKHYENQLLVIQDVCQQIASSTNRTIMGVMIESNLESGNQVLIEGEKDRLVYGQSVTDSCIGWDSTLDVLKLLSDAVRNRRMNEKK